MNFKSKILKLSIIFMLVLVLIPVANAMDSEDAFYQEYECVDDEGFVEEYTDWEVVYAPEEVSSEVEVVDCEESDINNYENFDDCSVNNQAEEDAIEIPEFNMESIDVTPYVDEQVIVGENEISSEICDNVAAVTEGNSDDELTFNDKISVNQGSIFISKHEATLNVEIINIIVNTGMESSKTSNLNNDLIELKNNLLIKQDIKTIHSNYVIIVDDLYNVVISVDNINSDFAYSIDNSIVGDANAMFSAGAFSCFLNFYPCFDATFSRDFLICEYNFCGNFYIVAADFFVDFVVEYNGSLNNFKVYTQPCQRYI